MSPSMDNFMKLIVKTGYIRIGSLCLLVCFTFGNVFAGIVNADQIDNQTIADKPIPQKYQQLHLEALDGLAEAQFQIGLLFEYGRDVERNDLAAVYWYEKSAAQQYSHAAYRLAILFDNGWGIEADKERAFDLYTLAAGKGHELAQHDLALQYFKGVGTKQNLLQAYKWMRVAVASGNALMPKHLNRIALKMSADEIAAAENLASEWIEQSGNSIPVR